MRFQDLLDETTHLCISAPFSPTVGNAWKQTDQTAAVTTFGLSVQLPPVALSACRNGRSGCLHLHLLIILVQVRVDDPVAKDGCSQVHIPCSFKEVLAFGGNGGSNHRCV